jgi:tetrahydromethanopterin S-methyltransferase subunit F
MERQSALVDSSEDRGAVLSRERELGSGLTDDAVHGYVLGVLMRLVHEP